VINGSQSGIPEAMWISFTELRHLDDSFPCPLFGLPPRYCRTSCRSLRLGQRRSLFVGFPAARHVPPGVPGAPISVFASLRTSYLTYRSIRISPVLISVRFSRRGIASLLESRGPRTAPLVQRHAYAKGQNRRRASTSSINAYGSSGIRNLLASSSEKGHHVIAEARRLRREMETTLANIQANTRRKGSVD
jgi:hypothetical protein